MTPNAPSMIIAVVIRRRRRSPPLGSLGSIAVVSCRKGRGARCVSFGFLAHWRGSRKENMQCVLYSDPGQRAEHVRNPCVSLEEPVQDRRGTGAELRRIGGVASSGTVRVGLCLIHHHYHHHHSQQWNWRVRSLGCAHCSLFAKLRPAFNRRRGVAEDRRKKESQQKERTHLSASSHSRSKSVASTASALRPSPAPACSLGTARPAPQSSASRTCDHRRPSTTIDDHPLMTMSHSCDCVVQSRREQRRRPAALQRDDT